MDGSPGIKSTLVVLGTALIALITSYAVASPKPTLYCVTQGSPFFISTLNASLPQAKCFRVKDGLFTDVLGKPSKRDKPVYLNGYVIPGIIESHGHVSQYGEMLESVLLYGAESIDDVRSRSRTF